MKELKQIVKTMHLPSWYVGGVVWLITDWTVFLALRAGWEHKPTNQEVLPISLIASVIATVALYLTVMPRPTFYR